MAIKPPTSPRLPNLTHGTRLAMDANVWNEASLALMGPAPFLDPFARARRANRKEASA